MIEGYLVDCQIVFGMVVVLVNFYGVIKCYGEVLCLYYVMQKGMFCVVLCIGVFELVEGYEFINVWDLSVWFSLCDVVQFFVWLIEVDVEGFFVVYGILNNCFKRFDLMEMQWVFGYELQDDVFLIFDIFII